MRYGGSHVRWAGALIAAGVAVGAIAWLVATRGSGPRTSAVAVYGFCGAPLLVFAGLAVLLHRWNDAREARYAQHLQAAARLDELLLHRVSVAIPARAAADLVLDGDPGIAHRFFDRIEPHFDLGARVAHVVESLAHGADPDEAIERALRDLEDRGRSEIGGTYRDEARASAAREGDDGIVIASVLIVAHPTWSAARPVRSVAEARALRDAILPVAPEHTRAARLVITPASGRSFDQATLEREFPELQPLERRAVEATSAPEHPRVRADVEDALRPAMRFALAPSTLEQAIEDALARFEQEQDFTVPGRVALARTIEANRASIAAPGSGGRDARRAVLGHLQGLVNVALARRGPARLARVVAIDGAPIHDARFVLLTSAERDRLRTSGRAVFEPWPGDTLRAMSILPLAIVAGAVTWRALGHLDPEHAAHAAIAWAAFLGARSWIRRRSVGLAMGRNAPG